MLMHNLVAFTADRHSTDTQGGGGGGATLIFLYMSFWGGVQNLNFNIFWGF